MKIIGNLVHEQRIPLQLRKEAERLLRDDLRKVLRHLYLQAISAGDFLESIKMADLLRVRYGFLHGSVFQYIASVCQVLPKNLGRLFWRLCQIPILAARYTLKEHEIRRWRLKYQQFIQSSLAN